MTMTTAYFPSPTERMMGGAYPLRRFTNRGKRRIV